MSNYSFCCISPEKICIISKIFIIRTYCELNRSNEPEITTQASGIHPVRPYPMHLRALQASHASLTISPSDISRSSSFLPIIVPARMCMRHGRVPRHVTSNRKLGGDFQSRSESPFWAGT